MTPYSHDAFITQVEHLVDRGMSPVPVPYQRKAPNTTGWQNLRLTREDIREAFPVRSNIGILLGEPSSWIVDVDIDSEEAMAAAPVLLPTTEARFGHGAVPESHWLFRVTTPVETVKFTDPTVSGTNRAHGASLIELRATGCQTVVPPSMHVSGEPIAWARSGDPAAIPGDALRRNVAVVASAALLIRHYPGEGDRHDAAMALAGGLLRLGWSVEDVGRFIGVVARGAGDEEVPDRLRTVLSSKVRMDTGGNTTGFRTLAKLIDDQVVRKVREWLGDADDSMSSDPIDSFDSYELNESKTRDPLAAERRARQIEVPDFPITVFPPAIQRYLLDGARTVGCPVDLIAVPFLGYGAAANGRQRRLALKRRWQRKGTMWVAVVASSGDGKSPADAYARAALDVLQDEADERFQEQFIQYKKELARWKGTEPSERDEEPSPPLYEHWYTTDPTVESLAPMLSTNSGIAAAFDELVAWARGCNSYKKGGNDRQKYLELWNGRPLKIDRKTQGVIFVRDPVCCLIGGIQPERVPEMASDGSVHDGLVPRFLWTYPDVQPSLWQWDGPDMMDLDPVVELFRNLRTCASRELTMHPEAQPRWEAWYNANRALRDELPPLAREMASKMPSHLASLWLVLHCLRDPEGYESQVRLSDLDAAIALVEYFRGHARRVLVHFGSSSPATGTGVASRVATVLRGAGGWVSRTDLSHALHRNVKADDLDAALASLVADGLVESVQEGEGVRATIQWRWIEQEIDGDVPARDVFSSYEGTNQSSRADIDSFDSYELTNQSLQAVAFDDLMGIDSFDSYEVKTTTSEIDPQLRERSGKAKRPKPLTQQAGFKTCVQCGKRRTIWPSNLCTVCEEVNDDSAA